MQRGIIANRACRETVYLDRTSDIGIARRSRTMVESRQFAWVADDPWHGPMPTVRAKGPMRR